MGSQPRLVDTSAIKNFIILEEVKRLDLQASKEDGWLRQSTLLQNIKSMTLEVVICISTWDGKIYFMVASEGC